MAAALYLFGAPIEGASTSLLLVAGTASVVWGLGMAAAAFSVMRRPTVTLVGRRVPAGSQPLLEDEVRRAAEAVGAAPPDQVVACLVPSVFVTALNVACLDGVVGGRTLCLSIPLARILTVDELRALLAHEFAHFSSGQEGYTLSVAPFYMGAARAIDRLGRESHGIRTAAVVPPRDVLAFFLDGMGEGTDPGIAREFEADQRAAAACGGAALASALVKAHAFGPAWHTVVEAMVEAVSVGTQYVNAGQLFRDVVASNGGPERLFGIGRRRADHPTDLHPTLAERLAALNVDLVQAARAALVTQPSAPAVSLWPGYEGVEQGLSAAEQQLIAATGGDTIPLPAA